LNLTISSLRCIQVIAGVLGRAGEAGQKERLRLAREEKKITFHPAQGLRLPESDETDSIKTAIPGLEENLAGADELGDKLEDMSNGDGRRMGHRPKIAA
jgi:small subunit ribosomal protein S2